MQICKSHWEKLKILIDEAGLSSFIAKDGKAAMSNALNELKGEESRPDPLMMANNMLWSRSIETFGVGMLSANLCPVCHANENYPDREGEKTGEYWVRTLVPHIKIMFVERGFLNTN